MFLLLFYYLFSVILSILLCTRSTYGLPVVFMGNPQFLMGKPYPYPNGYGVDAGRGVGNFTRGLPVSHLREADVRNPNLDITCKGKHICMHALLASAWGFSQG